MSLAERREDLTDCGCGHAHTPGADLEDTGCTVCGCREWREHARSTHGDRRARVDEQVGRLRRTATDPWKHRAQGLRCDTCMWYVAKHAPASAEEIGRCRRHAPTMNGYPVVFPVDWCGDHKLDEMKV